MHDVDRTLREFESTDTEFEAFEGEAVANELQGSVLGEVLGEGEAGETYEAQAQSFLGEGEYEHEGFLGEVSAEGVFDEVQEMELAGELLEIGTEAELEYFLGKLIKGAGRAIGGFVKSPVGKALGSALKSVAKKALPMAGAALGNLVLPGVGGAIGGKLASAAGNMFGLELEGLSPQDREFEVARRFVRFAGAAAARAARTPARVPPVRTARGAIVTAARRHAPGLLQPRPGVGRRRGVPSVPRGMPQSPIFRGALGGVPATVPSYDTPSYTAPSADPFVGDVVGYDSGQPSYAHSGRWYRRGRKVVLVGI